MAVAEVWPVADPGQELVDGRRRLDVAEAEWLARLGEFDRVELWRADGSFSGAEWVARRCRMGRSTAFEKLRVAHALTRRPAIADAFAAGELSYSHVRLITRIHDPDDGIDHTLVELAKAGSVRHLELAIRHYQLLVEQELPPPRDRDGEKGARSRVVAPGMRQQLLTLSDAEMAELDTAVEAFLDRSPPADGVPATYAARRADAILEMARTAIASCGKRAAGIDRYMVHVTIDLPTLLAEGPGVASLADGTPIAAADARRMACDAGVVAHFVRNGYEPLDLGRRVQSFTTGQRRAILTRDHHSCRFPRCDRTRVDCHHLRWWTNGGPTDVANGIALCRAHHTLIHKHGRHVDGDPNAALTFRRPDHTIAGHSPPPGALPHL